MIRLIPPVSVPVGALRVASTLLNGGGDRTAELERSLEASCDLPRAFLFGSGRAALASYLERASSPGRDEVVVPAYTCWSVPAAVVRAGMRVRLVDLDPRSFDIPPEALAQAISPRTAAVVAAHLLAPSTDVRAIGALVKVRDPAIRVIEDAAQARPGPVTEDVDAVILSFGRGKPVPLGGGGALLCREEGRGSPPEIRGGGWLGAAALAATSLLANPGWYRIPESIPLLGIGTTQYDPGFDPGVPFRRWQGSLAVRMLEELPRLERERSHNAARLLSRLEGLSGLEFPAPARAEGPLRLPLLAPSRRVREALLPALRERGVSASRLYPGGLTEIVELRPHLAGESERFPGARELADRLLTLPVYPGLTPDEVGAIGDAFRSALSEVGP